MSTGKRKRKTVSTLEREERGKEEGEVEEEVVDEEKPKKKRRKSNNAGGSSKKSKKVKKEEPILMDSEYSHWLMKSVGVPLLFRFFARFFFLILSLNFRRVYLSSRLYYII